VGVKESVGRGRRTEVLLKAKAVSEKEVEELYKVEVVVAGDVATE